MGSGVGNQRNAKKENNKESNLLIHIHRFKRKKRREGLDLKSIMNVVQVHLFRKIKGGGICV